MDAMIKLKIWFAFFAACYFSACVHRISPQENPQLYEENFVGEHLVLANCLAGKLQSNSGWSLRTLQFKNRRYVDVDASEVFAFDTRYLPNIVAANSPSNPDAVIVDVAPDVEVLQYAHRNIHNEVAYTAFTILIQKTDDAMVIATLKGDRYLGGIAWKILKVCVMSHLVPDRMKQ